MEPRDLSEHPRRWLRRLLTDAIREQVDFSATDQSRGLPPPPIQKPADPSAVRIPLPGPEVFTALAGLSVAEAVRRRHSVRRFSAGPLSLEQLAWLLWATQGVRQRLPGGGALRTVPSAGNRHAFETYLYGRRVTGIDEGIYRYLPQDHALVLERLEAGLGPRVTEACRGQAFAGDCAATFIWTAVPYRMEWRYDLAAHKVIALDAGHVCQNLYLACEAIGAGTCAIAAYRQEAMDALLGVDGEDEFTIYVAPVGWPA